MLKTHVKLKKPGTLDLLARAQLHCPARPSHCLSLWKKSRRTVQEALHGMHVHRHVPRGSKGGGVHRTFNLRKVTPHQLRHPKRKPGAREKLHGERRKYADLRVSYGGPVGCAWHGPLELYLFRAIPGYLSLPEPQSDKWLNVDAGTILDSPLLYPCKLFFTARCGRVWTFCGSKVCEPPPTRTPGRGLCTIDQSVKKCARL
jgi:hypothetical protein